jgi:hypothetical protein
MLNDEILHVRRKLAEIFESALNLGINVDNNAHVSGRANDEPADNYNPMY